MAVGSVNDQLNSLQNQINTLNTQNVPVGVVLMWSGSIGSIPSYWRLCNGSNGTPDLRNRFIVGAGSSYGVGNTGGADSVALSVGQLPSHTHSYQAPLTNGSHPGGDNGYARPNGLNSGTTGSAGSNQSHENRPPYYALCYIMKVSFA